MGLCARNTDSVDGTAAKGSFWSGLEVPRPGGEGSREAQSRAATPMEEQGRAPQHSRSFSVTQVNTCRSSCRRASSTYAGTGSITWCFLPADFTSVRRHGTTKEEKVCSSGASRQDRGSGAAVGGRPRVPSLPEETYSAWLQWAELHLRL